MRSKDMASGKEGRALLRLRLRPKRLDEALEVLIVRREPRESLSVSELRCEVALQLRGGSESGDCPAGGQALQ